MIKKYLITFILIAIVSSGFAQEKHKSLEEKNKRNRYTSFAFGMGASYSNNKSLNTFIGYEIPNYNTLPESQKLTDFKTGFDFFGSVEKQVHKHFSLKAEYSYFIKSNNLDNYTYYNFDYKNHQLFLSGNYIIPYDYIFFKIGAGIGGLLSNLSVKSTRYNGDYTSKGIAAKLDATVDMQFGNNMAIYLNGFMVNTFNSDLKDSDGKELKNVLGENVNLNSFSFGVRIGLEIFIF